MKFPIRALAACMLTVSFLLPLGAFAADTNADCHVRENGEDKKKKSGPCNVVEARGHIWILLASGDSFVLSPRQKKDRFTDDKGRDVKREMEAGLPVYSWEHRHITVNMKHH